MSVPYQIIYSTENSLWFYESRNGDAVVRSYDGNTIWLTWVEFDINLRKLQLYVAHSNNEGATWIIEKPWHDEALWTSIIVVDLENHPHVFIDDGVVLQHLYRDSNGSWIINPIILPADYSSRYEFDACLDENTGVVHLVCSVETPDIYYGSPWEVSGTAYMTFVGSTQILSEIIWIVDPYVYGYNDYRAGCHIVVDSNGLVHVIDHTDGSFDNDTSRWWHFIRDPVTGWDQGTVIYSFYDRYDNYIDNTAALDLYADKNGNVHLACLLGFSWDDGWYYHITRPYYRKWDANTGWGNWEKIADKTRDDNLYLSSIRIALLENGYLFVAWSDFGYGIDDSDMIHYPNIWYSQYNGTQWSNITPITSDYKNNEGLHICRNEPGTPRLIWQLSSTEQIAMYKLVEQPTRLGFAYWW